MNYLRYAQRSSITAIGALIIIHGGIYCLMMGFYKGPVEIVDSVYEARVIKTEFGRGRNAASGHYSAIYVQGDRKLEHFRFWSKHPDYSHISQAIRRAKRNDMVTVHSVISTYDIERIWKLESSRPGLALSFDRQKILREVWLRNSEEVVGARQRTIIYGIAVAIFVVLDIWSFRRSRDRVITDRVIYKASRGFYGYLVFVLVICAVMMLSLGVTMLGGSHTSPAPSVFLLIPILSIAAFLWLARYFYRLAKAVKHDIVLTAKGMHYSELLENYGVEFIPWSSMHFIVPVKHGFYIHLTHPLNDNARSDVVHIDTNSLKGPGNLSSDVESGIYGKLFPDAEAADEGGVLRAGGGVKTACCSRRHSSSIEDLALH